MIGRWSLQTRLMVTITAAVALIVIGVAVATSTILGGILQQNLHNSVREATSHVARSIVTPFPGSGTSSAYETLATARGLPGGFLLVVQNPLSGIDGAYLGRNEEITALTDDQLRSLTAGLENATDSVVTIRGLGPYVLTPGSTGSTLFVGGLPTSEVSDTITKIITTTLLVTSGGLLLLGAAIAFIVRTSLRPLRAVADTATRVAAMPLAEGTVSITERVPATQVDSRTEIGQVGQALNTLLEHVGASLDERQRNEERMRRFVADASHELRTPLASIRGYSELSLRSPDLGDTTAQALERIQAQSLRMSALVEDLLLLARLDEGRELVYGTVDLAQLAVEAVADARPAGPEHRWMLDVPDEPLVLAGDAQRLHQVVANLLANARIHTPAGTTVTVQVARDGANAVLRVHDDGPGIPAGVQLFERFSRADVSRARRTGGTGLGLSIAQAIVSGHGGTIVARSTPGSTSFEVRLPARPGASPRTRAAPTRRPPPQRGTPA